MTPPACCLRHELTYRLRVEAEGTPPGPCLLCGRPSLYRARWPAHPLVLSLDSRACSEYPVAEVYVDVCEKCRRRPNLEQRLDCAVQADAYRRRN